MLEEAWNCTLITSVQPQGAALTCSGIQDHLGERTNLAQNTKG